MGRDEHVRGVGVGVAAAVAVAGATAAEALGEAESSLRLSIVGGRGCAYLLSLSSSSWSSSWSNPPWTFAEGRGQVRRRQKRWHGTAQHSSHMVCLEVAQG